MADPPPYPDTGNDADDTAADREPAITGSWVSKVIIALVAALLAVIVILHLTGVVGPGTH